MSAWRSTLVRYTTSALALTGATAASNLIIIRWLEPEDAGIWQTLTLAQSYLGFIQLGVFNGLAREFPYSIGQGDRPRAERLAASAQSQAVVCSLVALILFLAAIPFFRTQEHWTIGLVSIAFVASTGFYRTYLVATYRSGNDFKRLSIINWINAALLVATVPLVTILGFSGLCLRLVIVAVVIAGLAHHWRPIRVPARWEWAMLRPMLAAGTPLLILGHATTVANGFDRLILLGTSGVIAVGLYTPALALKNALRALPQAINSYIAPRLSRDLGTHNAPRRLWSVSWRATLGSSVTATPVAVAGWWGVPWAIEEFFPQYAAGIPAARIILLAGIFDGIQSGTAALASLKSWGYLSVYTGATLALQWALPAYFAARMGPIVGVATGWVVARAMLFAIGLGCIYLATRQTVAEPVET